ncbi:exo-alpha-sialidase [Fibrella sp. HMF5405]|uniref:Exo-alpha-sialidase n=1 Tax=Fibrella forsythiae TaxID=2817061 RepID=A0ABS3JEI7_9BACT|nr:exo-alpha-sialidase [Fibrella forsythiae]
MPVVVADQAGTVHLTFGQDSTIYYANTNGQPGSFSPPVAVASLHGLVTTAKRGPQIAATDSYVVITVVNKIGDLFAYTLDRRAGKWSGAIRLNDVPDVAKEGFQAVASASSSTFHAAWLDLRGNGQNKIVGTTSTDGGRTWAANRIIYQSPGGSVCECCRVSVAARNNDVYVQFRNWLDGSRDLYLAHSSDGGRTYPSVQKLGIGTWQLAGCPMDGGGLALTPSGNPTTVWRRENTLYTCQPGKPETPLATGQNVTLASGPAGNVMAWDENGTVWLQHGSNVPVALGKGKMPSLALSGKSTVCVWEADGQIMKEAIAVKK